MPSENDWEALDAAYLKCYTDARQHKWFTGCFIELYKGLQYARDEEEERPDEKKKLDTLHQDYTCLADAEEAADAIYQRLQLQREAILQSEALLDAYWREYHKIAANGEGLWLRTKLILEDLAERFAKLSDVKEDDWQGEWK